MSEDKKIEPLDATKPVEPCKPAKQGFWGKLKDAIGTSIGEAADKR